MREGNCNEKAMHFISIRWWWNIEITNLNIKQTNDGCLFFFPVEFFIDWIKLVFMENVCHLFLPCVCVDIQRYLPNVIPAIFLFSRPSMLIMLRQCTRIIKIRFENWIFTWCGKLWENAGQQQGPILYVLSNLWWNGDCVSFGVHICPMPPFNCHSFCPLIFLFFLN